MFRKIVSSILSGLFLISSLILPLGDFSLLQDIPNMYRNYTKIVKAEEMGMVDFIGDYLLHGKELFGNNQDDKIPANGNNIQFQHQANYLNIVFLYSYPTLFVTQESVIPHPLFFQLFYTSDFRNDLYRPPLV